MNDHVWYAAYGSNLWFSRFRLYLEGGSHPDVQAGRRFAGCRNRTPPTDERVAKLPVEMYFARASTLWDGGGVAFVQPSKAHRWPCRLYRITRGQYLDVVQQENGDNPDGRFDDAVDLATIFGSGWYSRGLVIDQLDDLTIVTCTEPQRSPANPPAPAYLDVIRRGLVEMGLTPDALLPG